jgi:zinc transport system ATP-binding protein
VTTLPPVVELRSGVVGYGGRPVLRGVDLVVRPGEVVAILGANGSGKSTLVRALVGLAPLTEGSVFLFGASGRRRRHHARRIGYVPQRLGAGSGVPATVREVVSSGRLARRGLRPASAADRAAVDTALAAVDLADRAGSPVGSLSGGQQQRVLIARALAAEPDLLILDEPTAGVDAASQEAFAGSLRSAIADGVTILLVAHELGPLTPLITRVVVLRDGRVVHDAAPTSDHGSEHVHPHADPEPVGFWSGG